MIKEQKEVLKQLNEELNQLVKSKDKFHSIIAHDLKNPVGSLFSITEMLATEYDQFSEKEKRELVEISFDTSKQTLRLLENLLSWSRIQGGHLKVKKTCFDITNEVNVVIENLRQTAELKSINVSINKSNEINVFADKEMISTVIRNLFSNAVKFSNSGKKIEVGLKKKNNLVEVWIEDEGIGIPENKLDKLFLIDSGFQRSGTNDELGTGLGLQLSYEFVKQNDGYFDVKSEVNKGSRFAFFIPEYKPNMN